MRRRIVCINKDDRYDPWKSIKNIGIEGGNKMTLGDAIEFIRDGKEKFYVSKNGRDIDVIIAISKYGNECLKTVNDGEDENNLLSLDECPSSFNIYKTRNV